jgi:transposase
MDIPGINIAKAKFDVALMIDTRVRSATFSHTEAGFQQLLAWLTRHRPDPNASMHACREATGTWGIDRAAFLSPHQVRVSIVNPARIKASGDSELRRNKTDPLDAALAARFCRSQNPDPWTPPAPQLRELRELVRRCDALKAARAQELNRQKAGLASQAVARSIAHHLTWLNHQIDDIFNPARQIIRNNPAPAKNFALLQTIKGFGKVAAAVILAELPHIDTFTPKALAAFGGLSPQEHAAGSTRKPGQLSRIGTDRVRSTRPLCALSAKPHNQRLLGFAKTAHRRRQPHKVVLAAVARKLRVYANVVIKTQQAFNPNQQDA